MGKWETFEKMEVGMVLESSYGYDACLTHFYKVVKRTAKTVTLVELSSKVIDDRGYEGYEVMPADRELGRTFRRNIKTYCGHGYHYEYVTINSYRNAHIWDGESILNYNWH